MECHFYLKNYGCTHFIVWRDHAGPGGAGNGEAFYAAYTAQEICHQHEKDLNIQIAPFSSMVYVEDLDAYMPEKEAQ